jgi:hypothetical protein
MGLKANSLPLLHVAHFLFKFVTNIYYLHNIYPSVYVGVEQLDARTEDFHEVLVIFRKKNVMFV